MSRELVCQTCREVITVFGDAEYIDDDLYACPTCREPNGETLQVELTNGRTETLTGYRPDMAEIPF